MRRASSLFSAGLGFDFACGVDISAPEAPKIVANLPLENTIVGPPTNLAITPDGQLAIVANSLHQVPDGAGWKAVPDNKLYVIDLTATPPSHIATVEIGKQPSGLTVNPHGDLALVANRADSSISVLGSRGRMWSSCLGGGSRSQKRGGQNFGGRFSGKLPRPRGPH